MTRIALMLALLAAGCAPTAVIQYNGDSIVIQSASSRPDIAATTEARRICATKGLQAEYASSLTHPSGLVTAHLFLCLQNAKPHAGLPPYMSGTPGYLETTATL